MYYRPPGTSVCGISQARILEWFPLPSPGDLPDPGIELQLSRTDGWIPYHWATREALLYDGLHFIHIVLEMDQFCSEIKAGGIFLQDEKY